MMVHFFSAYDDKPSMFSAEMPCILDSMIIDYNGEKYTNHKKPEFIFKDTRNGTELTCVRVELYLCHRLP